MGFLNDAGKALGGLGSAASGLAGLGSLFTSGSNDYMSSINAQIASGKEINEKQIALMRENRDWQERMSNTAHQREVEDLRAAGINPLLSMGGKGADVSSISAPHLENPYAGTAAVRQAARASDQGAHSARAQTVMQGLSNAAQVMLGVDQLMQQKEVNEATIAEKQANVAETNAKTLKLSRDEALFPQVQRQMEAAITNLVSQSNAHNSAASLSRANERTAAVTADIQTGMVETFGEIMMGLGLDKYLPKAATGVTGKIFDAVRSRAAKGKPAGQKKSDHVRPHQYIWDSWQ